MLGEYFNTSIRAGIMTYDILIFKRNVLLALGKSLLLNFKSKAANIKIYSYYYKQNLNSVYHVCNLELLMYSKKPRLFHIQVEV